MRCAVAESGHLLGRKWAIAILEEIALGKFEGFNQFLRKAKMLTPRSLSVDLRKLENQGVIAKKTVGGRSAYTLTMKGEDLHKVVLDLKRLNVKWGAVPEKCMTSSCTECGYCSGQE